MIRPTDPEREPSQSGADREIRIDLPAGRYVILEHQWDGVHWDLMIEIDSVLRTWALPEFPRPDRLLRIFSLPDHRLDYLDYEGPVSRNRGSVRRWDEGRYRADSWTDRQIRLWCEGKHVHGSLILNQVRSADSEGLVPAESVSERFSEDGADWSLIWENVARSV